jgi:DNA-binding NarL/FixJ family response regulator
LAVRIAIIDRSGMLVDILRSTLGTEVDFDVVNGYPADALPLAIASADVVILDRELERAEVAELLASHPQTKLVAIVGDGRHSFLYELRPDRVALREISPQQLVDVIRRSTAALEPQW